MRGLSQLLNWNNAKEYDIDGVHFVITPVDQDIKPFTNKSYEAERALAFYVDPWGKMHMNVIEILSKKAGALGSNIHDIASTAFVNKYLGKSDKLPDVDANVIFYNEKYRKEGSFQVTGGFWSKANVNLQNQAGAPKRRTVPLMLGRTTCETCQHWYLIGFWYDLQTLQILDYEILAEWDECTESGGPPAGYGTDPTPPADNPPQQCINQNQAALDDIVNSATTENETISVEVSTINDITKNKNPTWVVLKGGGNPWKLKSTELGVVKLIDNATNKWQWESLVHGSISKQGLVIGGEVAIESQTGTPSFTAGAQNILYAGMSLDFTVKYTATPIPCPPFNWIIPPVYVSYQSNAIWPARP